MGMKHFTVILLFGLTQRGVECTCSSIYSQIQSDKIATMCKNSVVQGVDVFIDTDLGNTTTLNSGTVCRCNIQTQRGKQVSIDSDFVGPIGSKCGTSVDFTGGALGYHTILSTPCYSYNFNVASHTYTNMSVGLRRDYEPYSSPYCVRFSLNYCGREFFQCTNGACVPKAWRCDGEFDCSDKSDEHSCNNSRKYCSKNEHQCGDGTCIPAFNRCDLFPDCDDESDELSCGSIMCNESQIACDDNAFCINQADRCDGIYQCPDQSDELPKYCDPDYVPGSGSDGVSDALPPPLITITCEESDFLPEPTTTTTSTTPVTTSSTSTTKSTTLMTTTTSSTTTSPITTTTSTSPTTTTTTLLNTSTSTQTTTTSTSATTISTSTSATSATPASTTTLTTPSTAVSTDSVSSTTVPATTSSTSTTSTTSPTSTAVTSTTTSPPTSTSSSTTVTTPTTPSITTTVTTPSTTTTTLTTTASVTTPSITESVTTPSTSNMTTISNTTTATTSSTTTMTTSVLTRTKTTPTTSTTTTTSTITTTPPTTTTKVTTTSKPRCNIESQFQCGNGSCIPITWRCDSLNDCTDNSDEAGCSSYVCGENMFLCDERRTCIKSNERCDGKYQCPDLSDEHLKYCGVSTKATALKDEEEDIDIAIIVGIVCGILFIIMTLTCIVYWIKTKNWNKRADRYKMSQGSEKSLSPDSVYAAPAFPVVPSVKEPPTHVWYPSGSEPNDKHLSDLYVVEQIDGTPVDKHYIITK